MISIYPAYENQLASPSSADSIDEGKNHVYQNYPIPDLLDQMGHCNCSAYRESEYGDNLPNQYSDYDYETVDRPTVGESLFGFMNKSKSVSFRRKKQKLQKDSKNEKNNCKHCTCYLDPVELNSEIDQQKGVINEIYETGNDERRLAHEYQNPRELILAMISQSRFLKSDYLDSAYVNPGDLMEVSRTLATVEQSSNKNKLNLTINTNCNKSQGYFYDPVYDFVSNSPVIKKLRELIFSYPGNNDKIRQRLLYSIIAILLILVIILIVLNVLVPKLLIAQPKQNADFAWKESTLFSKILPTSSGSSLELQPELSTQIGEEYTQKNDVMNINTTNLPESVTNAISYQNNPENIATQPTLVSLLSTKSNEFNDTNLTEINENVTNLSTLTVTDNVITDVALITADKIPIVQNVTVSTWLPLTYSADFQCEKNQFKCANGSSRVPCLFLWEKCDGIVDCSDGFDEMFCDALNCYGNFVCDDGTCLSLAKACNGIFDCSDGSDEMRCDNFTCQYYEFRCPSGYCIPKEWTCDNDADCPDHADEYNCSSTCTEEQFMCSEGWCIPNGWRCNGISDCASGEDELNCSCSVHETKCNNGGCVEKSKICDGILHCSDGSDEHDCVRLEDNVLIIREPGKQSFLPVCAKDWSSAHADLVCKQLSFSKSLWTEEFNFRGNFSEVFATKFKTIPPMNADRTQYFLKKLPISECKGERFVKMECERFECGSWNGEKSRRKRIVGGKISNSHEWPSVGVLYHPLKRWPCAVSIVAPNWVVTSALCVKRTDPLPFEWKLVMGSAEPVETNHDLITRSIKKFVTHPSYKFKSSMSDYDVMLIQLDDPLPLHMSVANGNDVNTIHNSNNVAAICLPEAPTEAGSWCMTAGWGYTNPGGFQINTQLKHLDMAIWLKAICNGTAHYPGLITDRMMCAGNDEKDYGPCFNDEGGPLMCFNSHVNKWYLAGVLTAQNCGSMKHPSVYADIFSMKMWISDVIGFATNHKSN